LIDSLKFCQEHKGLLLHGWCIMSSHVHLLASSLIQDLSGTLRDFKKFTGKKLIEAIINNTSESRKEWMLSIFKNAGQANIRNTNFQFWRQDNQPQECYSPAFTEQKLNYIHHNRWKQAWLIKLKNMCTAVREIIIIKKIAAC